MTERVPRALEDAVKADLAPVRRLRSPARRALLLAPIAAVTLVLASRVFELRGDAGALGWALTWGPSIAQAVLAVALIALALRDAVPGRTLRVSALILVAGAALGFSAAVTLRTWDVSATTIGGSVAWVNGVCFTGTIVTALPLLAGAAVLARRAWAIRPWSVGALYGLGAGLGADAGWRLFCHYSDPAHVFPTHTGAVLVTSLLGMVIATLVSRLKPAPTTTGPRSRAIER